MFDLVDVKQDSAEWSECRRGVVTEANAGRLLRPKERSDYAIELVAETVAMLPYEAERWGIDNEAVARARYAFKQGVDVREIGLAWLKGYPAKIGCSPAGLVGEDGCLEVTSPNTKTHVRHWLEGAPMPTVARMQFIMWVCERAWCDFVSYDPATDMPSDYYRRRYVRDEALIAKLEDGAKCVLAMMEEARLILAGEETEKRMAQRISDAKSVAELDELIRIVKRQRWGAKDDFVKQALGFRAEWEAVESKEVI